MSNAILLFYNINVLELKKINENYYFNYRNSNYVIHLYERNIEEAIEIYYLNSSLLDRRISAYEIILTTNNEILFEYNKKYYILMKIPLIKNRMITYQDIETFELLPSTTIAKITKIDKSNWSRNWGDKIDFIEYQFDQIRNKYKIIDDSIDYYLGLWENAISYYNNNLISKNKVISHKRININMDLLEYINPLNFVVDFPERDKGEYLKSYVLESNYSKEKLVKILKTINKKEDVILLISRILFPSYYFDLYEDVVVTGVEEEKLKEIMSKQKNINFLLNYMFEFYSILNITKISWIKKDKI